MGYSVFQFGALYLDAKIQAVPKRPVHDGDISQYYDQAAIYIGPAKRSKGITWIKPDGSNLLIADRVLLSKISWENLNRKGFVEGKPVLHNGNWFRCRLLQVGKNENAPSEWNNALDETGEDNALWHWSEMYFLGAKPSTDSTSTCVIQGYFSARFRNITAVTGQGMSVGFRPALEPLPSDSPTPNINLDGADFQLTSLPGGDGFCPILQPTQGNVFKDISVGGKVRMYTLMEDGHPIHMDEVVKDTSKVTLTDRYFGDEYLIPWVVSNGIAVASRILFRRENRG